MAGDLTAASSIRGKSSRKYLLKSGLIYSRSRPCFSPQKKKHVEKSKHVAEFAEFIGFGYLQDPTRL